MFDRGAREMSQLPTIDRRQVLIGASVAASAYSGGFAKSETSQNAGPSAEIDANAELTLVVNGQTERLTLDPRTTLLDALREHLGLTGTKKGCDHGQCGACTVIVEGRRINSCLSFALMHAGESVTTIEGLAGEGRPHPMQAAFIKHDGFQCGYCTSGQICSSVAMLEELKAGMPSHVTTDLNAAPRPTSAEFRERMSGNICRCGAYSNIIDAIGEVSGAV